MYVWNSTWDNIISRGNTIHTRLIFVNIISRLDWIAQLCDIANINIEIKIDNAHISCNGQIRKLCATENAFLALIVKLYSFNMCDKKIWNFTNYKWVVEAGKGRIRNKHTTRSNDTIQYDNINWYDSSI